jgi:hypothetical protein
LKRFLKVAPALAIAMVALATVAAAASANGSGHGHGSSSTPGVLDANGDGIAAAAGKLSLHICAGEGILLTKGNVTIGEDAFTDQVDWLGLHVYFGFHGCADVSGTASMFSGSGGGLTAALAAGTGLTLHAEGTGVSFLKGAGTWNTSNSESGAWTADGAIVKIGGTQAPPCPMQAQHNGGHKKPTCATPEPQPTSTPAPEPTAAQ